MSSQFALLLCFGKKKLWFNKINYKNWAWNFQQQGSEEPACTQHIRLFNQAVKYDEGKFLKQKNKKKSVFYSNFYLFWQKKKSNLWHHFTLNYLILFETLQAFS